MIIHTIEFSVSADGQITPASPQPAGHSGDDGAAVLRFHVPFEGCRYRVEMVDGVGGYDITDLLDAVDGVVSCVVPSCWTAAGTAAVRLVVVSVGDDGTTGKAHTHPAYLTFEHRDGGDHLNRAARPAWQTLLDEAQFFLQSLQQRADGGAFKGDKGDKGEKGDKGDKGDTGAAGDTYVLTDADKEEIFEKVFAALPCADEVAY